MNNKSFQIHFHTSRPRAVESYALVHRLLVEAQGHLRENRTSPKGIRMGRIEAARCIAKALLRLCSGPGLLLP